MRQERTMGRFFYVHGLAAAMAFGGVDALAADAIAAPAAAPCVEVTVNGERAPSFDCMTDKLRPTAPPQGTAQQGMGSEAIVQRPSNQLGLFNRAATEHRMGNTFGTSVYPQRPPVVAPSSLLVPSR
jgi:hypothetical protein